MVTRQDFSRIPRPALLIVIAAAALVPVTMAVPALGQGGADEPVIVAIRDVFPRGMAPGGPQENVVAVGLRAPGRTDIIVLNPEYATPAGLRTGVDGLKRSRVAIPNPDRGVLLVLRTATPPQSEQDLRGLANALEKVRAQRRSQIGNIGPGRWFEFPARALMP